MPTYTTPGVYIQEIDTGNKPIEGVSTSIAGFLGLAERGPITATFITSFADFQRAFGSYYTTKKGGNATQAYLAYAVEGFFQNGGNACWIARVTGQKGGAKYAKADLANMVLQAAGPGVTGGQIGYQIQPAGIAPSDTTMFRLTLYYWATATLAATKDPSTAIQVESFDNLSINPQSSTYFVGAITSGSNLVTVTDKSVAAVTYISAVTLLPAGTDVDPVLDDFTGGSGTDPANPNGLAALNAIDDISIYCCPDEQYIDNTGTIADQLQTVCENLKDRFAILDAQVNAGQPAKVTPSKNSKRGYSAFYYPWLNVMNPKTDIITLVPPGGHIAGIYARSDDQENVAKDPANEPINGIESLQLKIDDATQGVLNPIGVNCLRYFKGQGNLVWGGRTTSPDPDWKYISIRRLFIYVEKSIQRGTQWVVFEPNDQPTWARVVRSVSDFLTGLWQQDMLQGATKEQAFFVRCDRTTMSQADIDNGRLIAVIGIAPVKPAEFVIFQIGQWTGGSSVTES